MIAGLARTVMERIESLGLLSEEAGCLTRRFATPALAEANAAVMEWMRAAGMTVWQDSIGNVRGRYAGTGHKTLLLGSHLDSVRDAGKFDGPLGVLVALACIEELGQRGERLPFSLELLAFADEEGLRYGTAYLGSAVVAGTFDPRLLERVDSDGISMRAAIEGWGGDPAALASDARSPEDLLGYCEVHIEQGPVLEAEQLPLGIVTGIAAQSRLTVRFTGMAGHAGTVPMQLRQDALCAAAAFVLQVERMACEQEGLVATVGELSVLPGASNVIPGEVTLSLDVRHLEESIRDNAVAALQDLARETCMARRLTLDWQPIQTSPSIRCSALLSECMAEAIERLGYSPRFLPSGAGHDAVALSTLTEVAMLFVRCRGGISHHPAEWVSQGDVEVAISVLKEFLAVMATHQP